MRNVAPRSEGGEAGQALGDAGMVFLRSALAGTLLWVGALKFVEYEAEQIQPMVSTSPLFSRINRMLGKRKLAGHLLDAVDQFPVYSGAYLATLEQLDL